MTLLDALVAITAIFALFGVSGYIGLKIIQLIREWITTRNSPADSSHLIRRIEQYEMRQEQLVKRIRNLETILMEADDKQQLPESPGNTSYTDDAEQVSDRALKNKLRA